MRLAGIEPRTGKHLLLTTSLLALPLALLLGLGPSGLGVGIALAQQRPRGVGSARAQFYAPSAQNTFRCLDGSKEIPFAAVNDDYCDCEDGSDEPGTSACPNSRFYCDNEGHIPGYVLSSRVNDGVCDPECCDGSDEYLTGACPNVCKKVGAEHRKRLAQEENTRRAGAKIRASYIAKAEKERERLKAEIATLEVEEGVKWAEEARLQAVLEEAESVGKEEMERKKASPVYATLQTHQSALRFLSGRNAQLKAELRMLTSILDDLARGYNPNYQDMAVKAAVVGFKGWKKGGSGVEGGGEDALAGDEVEYLLPQDEPEEWNEEAVKTLVDRDPLEVLMGMHDDGAARGKAEAENTLYRIHEYLPEFVLPVFDKLVDMLLEWLVKAHVVQGVTRIRRAGAGGASAEESPHVSEARAAHATASKALSDVSHSLSSKRDELASMAEMYGFEAEFKALEGECVSKEAGEYVYELCWFGKALQKPRRGAPTSLGTFSSWNTNATPDSDDYYTHARYDRGTKCWNGPERSVEVDLVCGTENALLNVFEAEKCIYNMKVSTPAVCFPRRAAVDLDREAQRLRDEL